MKEVKEIQIPLRLAWGLTIHKSKVLTLEKETINIGKNYRHGLTFTAISRVKALDGLRFQAPFSYNRYEKMRKCAGVSNRKAEEGRLTSLIFKYICYLIYLSFHFIIIQIFND